MRPFRSLTTLSLSALSCFALCQAQAGRSVTSYGAVANSKSDQSGLIQKALDDGGTIIFPAGVWRVEKTLYLHKPGTRLIGEGMNNSVIQFVSDSAQGAVIQAPGSFKGSLSLNNGSDEATLNGDWGRASVGALLAGSGIAAKSTVSALLGGGKVRLSAPATSSGTIDVQLSRRLDMCAIEDLMIDGSKEPRGTAPLVDLGSTTFNSIRNVWFYGNVNSGRVGLRIAADETMTDAEHSVIDQCYFGGVKVGLELGNFANSTKVLNCRFQPYGTSDREATGLWIHASKFVTSCRVIGNYFETGNLSAKPNGIVCDGAIGLYLAGNGFESQDTGWTVSSRTQQVTAIGNYYDSCRKKYDDGSRGTQILDGSG